jgi:NADPH:quinone reductase-like Zn-dependent oxidoreductase
MRAITVETSNPDSAKLEEVSEPDIREGSILVETIAVGVCGTDVEIIEGKYGWPLLEKRASYLATNPSAASWKLTQPAGSIKVT